MTDKVSYPMISEKVWWTLKKQFKKSVPAEISLQYLTTLLQLSNTSSAATIFGPLKQIGLIDEKGKPTDRLWDWRLDDKYKDVCNQILIEVYPAELLDLFPDPQVDKKRVENYFVSVSKVGEVAARKYAAFFALLKSGEVKDELPEKKAVTQKQESKRESKREKISVKNSPESEASTISTTSSTTTSKNNNRNATLHIDLQIHISPEASAEQIDQIFASISKHLYKD